MKIRIYYEDTDAGGIVYHSRYLNFCERARSELFFKNNRSPHIGGCHFAIKNLNANFVKFAILGDMLEVKTEVKKIKNASVELLHDIVREDQLIFRMSVTLVFLCKDARIGKIPEDVKRFFEGYTIS